MTNKCGINFQVGLASDSYQLLPCKTLSGFCLLLRVESWKKVGGFREDFSFYGQESNLLNRFTKMFVRKDVFVNHVGAASISRFPERQAEDKALGMEQFKRNLQFDFTKKLLIIGSYEKNPFPLWRGIEQGVCELGKEGMDVRYVTIDESDNYEERARLIDWDPDCVILVSTTISKIAKWSAVFKRFKCPKALWWNDLRTGTAKQSIRNMFDKIFLCYANSQAPYKWEPWKRGTAAKINYMPQGSVINPYLKRAELLWHALFIGNVKNLNGYHDDRWKFLEKFQPTVINEFNKRGRAAVESKSAKLYRQARFCWVLSPTVRGYNSLRLYNTLAYGGLALVKNFPDLDRLFTDRKHMLVYEGEEQAKKLLMEYVNQHKVCEVMRKAGWRRQQVKHTALYRIQNIMSNVMGWDDDFWGWV
jgi:hypothetical protein